jgi:hypothetical protein
MKALAALLLGSVLAFGQTNRGELRLKITDTSGATLRAQVELTSLAAGYDKTFRSDADGSLAIQNLAYGAYKLEVRQPGFEPFLSSIESSLRAPDKDSDTSLLVG